jgi:hypothetical protein
MPAVEAQASWRSVLGLRGNFRKAALIRTRD